MSDATERVHLDQDERYPFYHLRDDLRFGAPADVDTGTLARWRSVLEAFEQVQDEMGKVYDEAEKRERLGKAVAKAQREVSEAEKRLAALQADA